MSMLGGAWPLLSFIFIQCLLPGCAGLLVQLLPAGEGSALLRTDPLVPQGHACCLTLGSFCSGDATGFVPVPKLVAGQRFAPAPPAVTHPLCITSPSLSSPAACLIFPRQSQGSSRQRADGAVVLRSLQGSAWMSIGTAPGWEHQEFPGRC